MSKDIERLIHRYRILKNLGLEDDIIPIAINIAEALQKELEGVDDDSPDLTPIDPAPSSR